MTLTPKQESFCIAYLRHVRRLPASIDLVDTVATVRLELNNLSGYRYTDMFTLLKVDGEWKIMNKVFHLHS